MQSCIIDINFKIQEKYVITFRMFIEGVYLKYIKIKNLANESKQFYIILHINDIINITPIIFLPSKNHLYHSCLTFPTKVNRKDNILFSIWNYDHVKLIQQVNIDVERIIQAKNCRIIVDQIELQIFCEAINRKKQIQAQQQIWENNKRAIKKQENFERTPINREKQKTRINNKVHGFSSLDQVGFKSKKKNGSFLQRQKQSHPNSNNDNQTSLQKLIEHIQINKKTFNDQNRTKSSSLLDLIQNRKTVPYTLNFYDDYEANKKQNSLHLNLKIQSIKSTDNNINNKPIKDKQITMQQRAKSISSKIKSKISQRSKQKQKHEDNTDKISTSSSTYIINKKALKNAINKLVQNRVPKDRKAYQEKKKAQQILLNQNKVKKSQQIKFKQHNNKNVTHQNTEFLEYGFKQTNKYNYGILNKQIIDPDKNQSNKLNNFGHYHGKNQKLYLNKPKQQNSQQSLSRQSSFAKSLQSSNKLQTSQSLQKNQSIKKKSSNKIQKLQDNINNLYKNMNKLYTKNLTTNQIELASKMNTLELSQSIYQLYGLDLSKDFLEQKNMVLNRKQKNIYSYYRERRQQSLQIDEKNKNIDKRTEKVKNRISKQQRYYKIEKQIKKLNYTNSHDQFQEYGS